MMTTMLREIPLSVPARRRLRVMVIPAALCALLLWTAAGCGLSGSESALQAEPRAMTTSAMNTEPDSPDQPSDANRALVTVRVFNEQGELVGPIRMNAVIRSEAEWRELLTPEQFDILRSAGTERPFCGELLDNKLEGVYACVGCRLPLFSSASKFDSRTGWPSFFQPIAAENVAEKIDRSYGMIRTEINCARCDGHLGHVFDDGPRPTGLRFCLNSESLMFTELKDLAQLADPAVISPSDQQQAAVVPAASATAVFAGGCFWCVEAVFEELEGVIDVISGYAGDTKETANYQAVSSGRTRHAEAVRIIYDPAKVSYVDLLRVHFATHDPTTLNRQGNDIGRHYRSAIFFADEAERAVAQAFIDELTELKLFPRAIVTTLEPLTAFYDAEPYHQNYVCENPMQSYVRGVALPKVEKVRKEFKDMVKEVSPLEERRP